MAQIPMEETITNNVEENTVEGGAFNNVQDTISPFGYKRGEGIDAGVGELDWIVNRDKPKYDEVFNTLNPVDGKVTGMGKYLIYKLCSNKHFGIILNSMTL